MSRMPELRIRLVDKDSNAPIAFVTIAVDGAVATTNMDGVAVFDLPVGEYVVQARPPFYEPLKAKVRSPGFYTFSLRTTHL